jgi:hypothetical protein
MQADGGGRDAGDGVGHLGPEAGSRQARQPIGRAPGMEAGRELGSAGEFLVGRVVGHLHG